ncbi:hypothetical protein [Tomitella gaofuii]|uniref:hypothetical protein n=1 Tax=Tomitella gaofuii TaxID=2760083 RepID=UPI003B8A739D
MSASHTAPASSTFPAPAPRLAAVTAVDPAAEVLVVGLSKGEEGPFLADLGPLSGGLAADVLARLESVGADGAAATVHRVPAPPELGVASVLAVGLGDAAEPPAEPDDAAAARRKSVSARPRAPPHGRSTAWSTRSPRCRCAGRAPQPRASCWARTGTPHSSPPQARRP